jgi:hypothetical protein
LLIRGRPEPHCPMSRTTRDGDSNRPHTPPAIASEYTVVAFEVSQFALSPPYRTSFLPASARIDSLCCHLGLHNPIASFRPRVDFSFYQYRPTSASANVTRLTALAAILISHVWQQKYLAPHRPRVQLRRRPNFSRHVRGDTSANGLGGMRCDKHHRAKPPTTGNLCPWSDAPHSNRSIRT